MANKRGARLDPKIGGRAKEFTLRKAISNSWTIAILTVLIVAGIFLATAAAQKASVPRRQDRLAMGEEPTRQLLLVMSVDGKDTITKQEYLKFMEQEFDRLDREKKGLLDARQLNQTQLSASHFAGK